jgi:hypothetical protein
VTVRPAGDRLPFPRRAHACPVVPDGDRSQPALRLLSSRGPVLLLLSLLRAWTWRTRHLGVVVRCFSRPP